MKFTFSTSLDGEQLVQGPDILVGKLAELFYKLEQGMR